MGRIKLIVFASFLMCSTIFISSFFFLKELPKEDVYQHMNKQFEDVFEVLGVSLENNIISQEEFSETMTSEVLKERVEAQFSKIETNSYYAYGEDTISEVNTSIKNIYEKELQRLKQTEAKKAVFLVKLLSFSASLIACAILFILYKKKQASSLLKEKQSKKDASPVEKPLHAMKDTVDTEENKDKKLDKQ